MDTESELNDEMERERLCAGGTRLSSLRFRLERDNVDASSCLR